MKINKVSKALEEVWDWKDQVYNDIKNKSFIEKKKYYNDCIEQMLKDIHGEMKENDDGSYTIVCR